MLFHSWKINLKKRSEKTWTTPNTLWKTYKKPSIKLIQRQYLTTSRPIKKTSTLQQTGRQFKYDWNTTGTPLWKNLTQLFQKDWSKPSFNYSFIHCFYTADLKKQKLYVHFDAGLKNIRHRIIMFKWNKGLIYCRLSQKTFTQILMHVWKISDTELLCSS